MRVISGKARGTTLHSIEDIKTRPTLDRVKESLFNIISNKIDEDTVMLDLFAGSGAIGIEFLSRGAKEVYFNDYSSKTLSMLKENLLKTKLNNNAKIMNKNYTEAIKELSNNKVKFDFIYLDPPYKENFLIESIEKIEQEKILKDDGIIILETDEEEKMVKEIENHKLKYKIYDIRKYGRAYLIFLNERGK